MNGSKRVGISPELIAKRRNQFHKHIVQHTLRKVNTTHGTILNRKQNGHVHGFLLKKSSVICYKEHLVTRMKASIGHIVKGLPKRDTGLKVIPKDGLHVSTDAPSISRRVSLFIGIAQKQASKVWVDKPTFS